MKIAAVAALPLLVLAACGQAESPAPEKVETAKSEPAIAPSIPVSVKHATRGPVDLTPYIGKYPFDVVNGHRFLDHPAVKAAIAASVPDAKTRAGVVFPDRALGLPIIKVEGGRILIWGGDWRAEDRYNWSVVIAPDGSKPEVCIYDGVAYGEDSDSSEWFEPGKPSVMNQGSCPSSAEDYPPEEIAAG